MPGVEVRVFGSRASGSAKPASDLDLLVLSNEPLDPLAQALLADAFAESDLPFRVDLIDSSSISEEFRTRVIANSVVVQRRSAA